MEPSTGFFNDGDYSDEYTKGVSLEGTQNLPNKCEICKNDLKDPVVLNCLHVFDKDCLSNFELKNDDIFTVTQCPKCGSTSGSIASLEPFHIEVLDNLVDQKDQSDNGNQETVVKCTLCTTNDVAHYKCADCAETLCESCKKTHKVLKMFSSHVVTDLTEEEKLNIHQLNRKMNQNKPVLCTYHKNEPYRFFCFQCNVPLCSECASLEHKRHITCNLDEAPAKLGEVIQNLVKDCQSKQTELKEVSETLNNMLMDLSTSRDQNRSHIEETCNDWKAAIEEIKDEFLKKNKDAHDRLEMKIIDNMNVTEKTIDHIDYSIEFINSYLDKCRAADMAKVTKMVMSCLEQLSKVDIDTRIATAVPFDDDRECIRDKVRSMFGWFGDKMSRPESSISPQQAHAANVATSAALSSLPDYPSGAGDIVESMFLRLRDTDNNAFSMSHAVRPIKSSPSDSQDSTLGLNVANDCIMGGRDNGLGAVGTTISSSDFGGSVLQSRNFNGFHIDSGLPLTSMNGSSRTGTPSLSGGNLDHGLSLDPSLMGLGSTIPGSSSTGMSGHGPVVQQPLAKPGTPTGYNPNPNPPFPNRSGRCLPMNVRNRWGSLGNGRGQLSSPHGFCLGFDEEIVVADTQNHRIQEICQKIIEQNQ